MQTRNYFYILIIVLSSCNSSAQKSSKDEIKDEYFIQQLNHEYNFQKAYFDQKFVNHFPDSIYTEKAKFLQATSAKHDLIRFELNIQFETIELDSLIMKYSKNAIAKYGANDSCLLIVNRFTNNKNWLQNPRTSRFVTVRNR